MIDEQRPPIADLLAPQLQLIEDDLERHGLLLREEIEKHPAPVRRILQERVSVGVLVKILKAWEQSAPQTKEEEEVGDAE